MKNRIVQRTVFFIFIALKLASFGQDNESIKVCSKCEFCGVVVYEVELYEGFSFKIPFLEDSPVYGIPIAEILYVLVPLRSGDTTSPSVTWAVNRLESLLDFSILQAEWRYKLLKTDKAKELLGNVIIKAAKYRANHPRKRVIPSPSYDLLKIFPSDAQIKEIDKILEQFLAFKRDETRRAQADPQPE